MPTPAARAALDPNRKGSLLAVSNVDFATIVAVAANPTTGAIEIEGTITASPASVGATGSAVPASADYEGINVAGTLRGATGVNPSGTVYAQQVDVASVGGTTFALGQQLAATSLPVVLTAAQITTLTPLSSVTVTQATAASLNATVVGTGTFAVQATLQTQTDTVMVGGVNIKEINAVAPLMGNGTTGTGSLRVTIASDNTAFAVNATLSAETTKVIGTARIIGNAGATLDSTVGAGTAPTNQVVVGALYNSTEISPSTGQAFALQADSKGRLRQVIMDAAGNTRGVNVDASNRLSVTVDNIAAALTLATVTTVSTVTSITNNVNVIGTKTNNNAAPGATNVGALVGIANAAQQSWTEGDQVLLSTNLKGSVRNIIQDAALNDRGANVTAANELNVLDSASSATSGAVPSKASYIGGNAATALPTAATPGNITGALMDKFGRQVVLPMTVRDLTGTQTTTISASTSETTIVTQAASVFNDLLMLVISNTSATGTRLDFRDTTGGSVLFSLWAPANDTRGFSLGGVAVPQTSVNTNWTAQSSASVTDLRIYAVFAKNK